jgi:signal transduction histidine kinase
MNDIFQAKFSGIISTALEQKELHGIVAVLKQISEAVDACCCILWETDPWAVVHNNPPIGKLYIYARWLCDDIGLSLREIPIDGSANGLAITTGEIQTIDDMRVDSRTHKDEYSIEVVKFTSMCAVPLKFASKNYNVSLSVYRRREIKPFTNEETDFIRQCANLIPLLDQAIRDKVRRFIVAELSEIFDKAEQAAKADKDNIAEIENGLRQVCIKVAETFGCIEVSLFLENWLETENQFRLRGTSYLGWSSEKRVYSPERDRDHLTGWVLSNMQSVSIFDLGNFYRDRSKLREQYKDINWKDSLNIKQAAEKILKIPIGSLPPLSFMAVPITKGTKLLGVIRCCTARRDPWFFSDRQQRILELIAKQIGRFWSDWLQHIEEKKESVTWEKFIEDISTLNAKVRNRIDKSDIDEEKLYSQILDLAKNAIKNSDILDIRLYDEKSQQLYFAKTKGFSKSRGTRRQIEERRKKRFPIKKYLYQHVPLGVLVFEDGIARSVMNAEVEDYRSKTFPETKRIICAPIGVQKDTIGVLDIRGTSDKPFPPHALRMAELLGQQLGLYLSLWQSEQQQRQAFEDLWHQIKSPVRHTFARANALLHSIGFERWHSSDSERVEELENQLLMLRGVARKAKRVAVNAGVFKDLSTEGKLTLTPSKLKRLNCEDTLKMLFEAYKDTQILLEDYRNIKFFVDRKGFRRLDELKIKGDSDFIEQAINCLLDNAGKYSFSNTTVRITGGAEFRDGRHYFYFAVSDQGFEVTAEEAPKLKERYYRGVGAKASTGEGSGIGLWVVDHIMKAHGGELEIIPTTSYGQTEVRLLFPAEE